MPQMTLNRLRDHLLALPKEDWDFLRNTVEDMRRKVMYEELQRKHRKSWEARALKDEEAHGVADYCRIFSDGLDGYTVHARACPNWPKSYTYGSACINIRRVQ